MSGVLVHGVDLVAVERIAGMVERHGDRFLERVFTETERAYRADVKRRDEHLAARFAAKEAGLKALGVGLSHGIGWRDVHVTSDAQGKPILHLEAAAADRAAELGVSRWALSLTHAGGFALASVVGTG